jgi:hypothetical protein
MAEPRPPAAPPAPRRADRENALNAVATSQSGNCANLENILIHCIKYQPNLADILIVGFIVPLPNHYISDMPKGAWAGGIAGLFLVRFQNAA